MELQQNTSGQGASAIVPDEIKGWNWGAFWLNWIWSIGNQVWIGLLSLVIGIIMAIILGVKGNEWAWQNRKWVSVEQFKETQKKWAMWGWIYLGITVIITVLIMVISGMIAMKAAQQNMSY